MVPLHIEGKADGTWQPCDDCWRLSLVTTSDLKTPAFTLPCEVYFHYSWRVEVFWIPSNTDM